MNVKILIISRSTISLIRTSSMTIFSIASTWSFTTALPLYRIITIIVLDIVDATGMDELHDAYID